MVSCPFRPAYSLSCPGHSLLDFSCFFNAWQEKGIKITRISACIVRLELRRRN